MKTSFPLPIQNALQTPQAEKNAGILRPTLAFLVLLVCGLLTFILASNYFDLFPTNRNPVFEGGLAAAFLLGALLLGRKASLKAYSQAAYAFFVMAFVFFITTLAGPTWYQWVLNTTGLFVTSTAGIAVAKAAEVVLSVGVILLLVRLAGGSRESLSLVRGNLKLGLFIGLGIFANFATSAFLFFTTRFTGLESLAAAATWGLVFSLANGFMEELWFRGLLLKKLDPLIGTLGSTLLTSLLFALMHAGSVYLTPVALPFMIANTFTLGLACAIATRKTGSLLAPTLIHAAADYFLFIAMLSVA